MTNKIYTLFLSTMLVLAAAPGQADDIDIYYGSGALPEGSEPMVMFSLDWRPNLGSTACGGSECDFLLNETDSNGRPFLAEQDDYTYFDVLRAVLRKVMDPLDGLRVGLMLNHDYKNNCAGNVSPGCSNGGYIALGFESFEAGDANGNKEQFHTFLDNMPTPQGNASHKYQGRELFFEFFRYLTGQNVLNGHVGYLDFNGFPEDGGTRSDNDRNLDEENPAIAWDTSIEAVGPDSNIAGGGNIYISPLQAGGRCTKIFSVNMMFQVSQQEADSDDYIEASEGRGGMGSIGSTFPDVIEYLNDADLADGTYADVPDLPGVQNVRSYFIVDETKINTTTRKYAKAGDSGEPLGLSENPDELVKQLEDVFKQILSVSTTFVSASIPVNAFNRAEVIDNVYLALFKTDPDDKAVWTGNIKKMKLAAIGDGSGSRTLVDALGNYAVAADGRIKYDALTFWTDAGALPPAIDELGEVTGRDGRSTTRGGAGQKIPGLISGSVGLTNGDSGRQLFYDLGGSLTALNADSTTAGNVMGAMGVDEDEALDLIKYARGIDVDDEDNDNDDEEARSWLMGDPLHSRPLPINYGAYDGYTENNQAIYIAVGSNDGYMRLIRNTERGETGGDSGEEVWAFMPQEVMGSLPALRANGAAGGHEYLLDGSPSAYVEGRFVDRAINGQAVYMYFGLRRGGKAYYGLDITDPEDPSMLWKITKSGDFAELGLTFSDPVVGRKASGDSYTPLVIFGGGYDTNKDVAGVIGSNDTEGNALYVVDGESGELIWKAVGSGTASSKVFIHPDLVDSVPSQVTILDSDSNQATDRVYFGDTGGRVWRADIGSADTNDWKLTLLADVGRHYSATIADDRRFFHAPDIVQHVDKAGKYDAVVIGSGNRANPLGAGGFADNYTYMIRDENIKSGAGVDSLLDHTSYGDVTSTCLEVGSECLADLENGWKLGLTDVGEASLARPLTIGGVVYFTTYLPPGESDEASCGPDEGSGRFYSVSLGNAAAVRNYDTTTEELERSDDLNSEGIPAAVFFLPGTEGIDSDTGEIYKPDNSTESVDFPSRMRTYWLESEDGEL
jgi:type IV pilus assembly protein PilY1